MTSNVWPLPDRGAEPESRHQADGQRRADHRAAAEAHDGHAGGHAGAVGEPFDQRRNRRDVAEAQADAADHAVAEINEPELVDVNAQCGDEETAAETARPRRTWPCAARLFPATCRRPRPICPGRRWRC